MGVDEYSTGLPQNHSKRFDALTYKTAYATEEWDSNFTDDNCIVVYHQAHTPMMDTGTIQKGELAGFYALKVFWTSDNLGGFDIEVLIYKDGTLDDTLTKFYGGDYLTTGSIYNVSFSPLSEYRIVVQTGSWADQSEVKLDYIQLDSIPHNAILSGRHDSSISDGSPYLEVRDHGTLTHSYSGVSAVISALTFNVTFTTPPEVRCGTNHGDFMANGESATTTGCNVKSRNVDGTSSTLSLLVYWEALGSVAPPFKSVGYAI